MRIWRGLSVVVVLGLMAVVAGGCQNQTKDENARLRQQNRDLQAQLNEANTRLKSAPDASQMSKMQQDLAAREARIKELEASLRTPTPGAGAQPGLEGIETTYDKQAGTLTVTLPGDVLFGVGQADLKRSSRATLDKIVAVLNSDYAGKAVRVEGYTDTDPVVKTKAKWGDNLGLSKARAASVARYLTGHGVTTSRVTTVGYGAARPKATKAKSRRVEIVVQVR